MDKLAAVNLCLSAIDNPPLTSLGTGDPIGSKAATTLDRVSELVQSTGWSFNTDFEVTLAIDIAGKIPLPAATLEVSAQSYNSGTYRVSKRKDPSDGVLRLWDVRNKTWVFPAAIKVDLIYLYDFDELPINLQHYIAARCAREFQEDQLGAANVDKFLSRREAEALTALIDAEAFEEDVNILTDSPFCRLVTYRYNEFYGR